MYHQDSIHISCVFLGSVSLAWFMPDNVKRQNGHEDSQVQDASGVEFPTARKMIKLLSFHLSKAAKIAVSLILALSITFATFVPILLQAMAVDATPLPPIHSTVDYPDPQPCSGNCTWIIDPSVVYENGTYWRFSTAGNIAIASAPALEGPWEYKGALLDNGTSIFVHATQDVWAPSVTKINDTFYCHYAVSTMYSQASQIGVATSKSLEPGTWQDHGSMNILHKPDYNLIDPYVYQENPSSPIYLTFGSYWGGIYQGSLSGADQLLRWDITQSSFHNIVKNTTRHNPAVVESATMYKHDDGMHYIFFSVGQCCKPAAMEDVYRVVVCRAISVEGPFVDKAGYSCLVQGGGMTILASHGDVYAPGGQEVMRHPENNKPVMVYHYLRPGVGFDGKLKHFGFNYLEWQDGWPVVV